MGWIRMVKLVIYPDDSLDDSYSEFQYQSLTQTIFEMTQFFFKVEHMTQFDQFLD